MAALFGWVIGFVGSLFTRFFAFEVARWIAVKALVLTLMVTVLPIVLNNFVYSMMQTAIETMGDNLSSYTGTHVDFGAASWAVGQLRIPEGLSIVFSALAARFSLDMFRRFL